MKVQTNIRAGAQTRSRGADNTTADTSTSTPVVVVYYPPVTRCVGI